MVDVDAQDTSKITMICRAECRGHTERDTQADGFRPSKL